MEARERKRQGGAGVEQLGSPCKLGGGNSCGLRHTARELCFFLLSDIARCQGGRACESISNGGHQRVKTAKRKSRKGTAGTAGTACRAASCTEGHQRSFQAQPQPQPLGQRTLDKSVTIRRRKRRRGRIAIVGSRLGSGRCRPDGGTSVQPPRASHRSGLG